MNRRELLAAYSTMLTVGVAGCNAPRNSDPTEAERPGRDPAENWPMFLYNSTNRRGFSNEDIAVERPSIRWSYETGGPVWASPVVADGTLYIGSYDGYLYAISAETGEMRWRYRTDDRIDGSPAVVDGTVYFGSFDRNIYALDAETGDERWIHGTRGIVRSSPTVADGIVYIGAYCRTEECSAYYDVQWPEQGYVYALDAETGDLRWRYETNDGVISTPAIRDGTVYVGSSDATLSALDASTGETRWTYETDGPIMSSATCVNGRVVFGTVTGELYSVDPENGDRQWSFSASRPSGNGIQLPVVITGSPLVYDGTVYVGSMVPGNEVFGRLYAISADDGTPEWSESPFAQAIGSSAVAVNDIVYFGSHILSDSSDAETGLYAVDTDGTRRWEYVVDGEDHNGFGSSPAVVDTTLYIGSTDGNVHAFNLE